MRTRLWILLCLLFAVILPSAWAQNAQAKHSYLMYVGTYTGPASKGIYAFRFDPDSGTTEALGLAAESASPSFLAADGHGDHLYAANEISDYKGEKTGAVSSFVIDHSSGRLTFLNEVASRGAGPCHLALDRSGKFVLVANYDGGTVATFPIRPDGRLGEAPSVIQHHGHGPDAERQEGPHAHEVQVTADNRVAIAADLGLDELLVYRFDSNKGTLTANDPPFAQVSPGSGPRHFAFHPNGNFVYVLNEMGGSITSFEYQVEKGALSSLQTISTLPKNFKGQNTSAELVINRDGKYLYASNRGPDTIAEFAIDPASGKLSFIDQFSTKGKTPRNFALDPTGRYLFAANQDSNNIVIFRVDPATGRLTASGQVLNVPSPVCIVFVPN